MSNPQFEEAAALQVLGLLDDTQIQALAREAGSNADLQGVLRSFAESAALLAYDAPQVNPPSELREKLMRQISGQRPTAQVIQFPQWIPYTLAACLTALVIYQANEIFGLNRQVGAEHSKAVALQERNYLTEVRLASLQAKDAGYVSAKVMVAWDPQNHNGVVSVQDLPAPPPGHDYQLWVLDPSAAAPISAGLLKSVSGSQDFAVHPIRSAGPGFAISLEPSGGRPAPTGAILFAVAPGS